MKIAIEGCAHGELDIIYDTLKEVETQKKIKIDLLICCGDFQTSRNEDDLKCMAVPDKYSKICSFYKYYTGERVAPILTIFIGGNHEASNYLQELPYGGWVAPNIYYMGYAGVVTIGGLRISGLSGIYKNKDYLRGHFEMAPYSDDAKRSVYHIRNLEVFRLKQLSEPIDIFLSHDWPTGVTEHGNKKMLLKRKPFFKEDIENGRLGSKPAEELLLHLKPAYWFSAHLHCKFAALVKHEDSKVTKFLALDKCLPKRKFLQVLDIPHKNDDMELKYDLEWLTVLHLTNHLLSVKRVTNFMPGPGGNERHNFTPTEDEKQLVLQKFNENLRIPTNFKKTAPGYVLGSPRKKSRQQPEAKGNPQTQEFCELLSIDDPLHLISQLHGTVLDISIEESANDTMNNTTFILDSDCSMNNSVVELEISSQAKKIGTMCLPKPKQDDNTDLDDSSLTLPSPVQESDKKEDEEVVNEKSAIVALDPLNEESTKNAEILPAVSPKRSLGSAEKSDNDSHTAQENNEDEVSTVESSPMTKKFKRRNADLYNAEEN